MPVASTNALLTIRSGQGDYSVTIVATQAELLAALPLDKGSFVVIDSAVDRLYPELRAHSGQAAVLSIDATEDEKSLYGVERICTFLQENGASKGSQLIVIGGGIVQDLGAFASHMYYRGIPFHYVPTTLLSMGDSCIGAKCGVNLGSFKNQLGFFQAPSNVVLWHGFLGTLAVDDVRSGFGEILKLAITAGESQYRWFEKRISDHAFDLNNVEECILLGLNAKKPIIEADEYERNSRKILNYGHTFGHALETITKHEIPHGIAVAWGVDIANYIAWQKELLPEGVFTRIHTLIKEHFSRFVAHSYSADILVDTMGKDKKAAGASVQLILLTGIGSLKIVPTIRDESFIALVDAYMRDYNIFRSG